MSSEYNRVLGSIPPSEAAMQFPASDVKTNTTPDLDDEQYMEQLHLIAQVISVMPGITDKHPNATTPPPIRPRWAKYLISLGVRIDPEKATHHLKRVGPDAAGNHAPREIEVLHTLGGKVSASFSREKLFEMWKDANPETYDRTTRGEMDREELWNSIPGELRDALRQAEDLARREAPQQEPPP